MTDEIKRGPGRPRKPVAPPAPPPPPISLDERRKKMTQHTKERMDELEQLGLTVRNEMSMRVAEFTPEVKEAIVDLVVEKQIFSFDKLAEALGVSRAMIRRIRQRDTDWDNALKLALADVSIDRPRTMMGAAVEAGINSGGNISMPQYLAGVTLLRHEDPSYGEKAQTQINVGMSAEQVGQLVQEMSNTPEVRELIRARTARLIGPHEED